MADAFKSFTPPFTASGRAALVPAPPWHYAGWLMNVAFACPEARGAQIAPASLGRLTGTGCIHFADWQATTDGAELADPEYAQYRETILIVQIERPDSRRFNYCPFIWVDQDIALLRGLLQGWPKKLGATHLTRSLPLAHPAAAPIGPGTRLGAALCVKGRRLVETTLELTGKTGAPHGFLTGPTIGAVGWPDLRQPQHGPQIRWVLPDIRGKVASTWHAAEASLTVLDHPWEELELLGEISAVAASVGWVGLTVAGAVDLPD